ncbi:MFS transporter [bacterium]|nr:MFS transporter [bacterium]
MSYRFSPEILLQYFLKRESTQFFVSVAIRYLALGMVGIYEPVFIYLYFNKNLAPTLLFWAAIYGLFGLFVVFGGKIMARIGLKHTMLISQFFFFAYYLALFFIYTNPFMVILAVLMRSLGMTLFWPAFHTDFVRFTKKEDRGADVGKLSGISFAANIISPVIGGIILANFGYLVLFVVVLVTLLASVFPLFLSKERYEIYSDTYTKAWQRIRKNKSVSLGLASLGIESAGIMVFWPLFMFIKEISFEEMGGITTFGLLVATLFALYIGRLTTKKQKTHLLSFGSYLLSLVWIVKCFVKDTLTAFLAHNFYRIAKTSAFIPFRTIIYDKAAAKKEEADEFLIYREVVLNLSKMGFLTLMAIIFVFLPDLRIGFLFASIGALGMSFLGKKLNSKS